jgi:tetratricopeptide (TPR) repeat protein
MENIRALLFLCFFTIFLICCGTLICYIKLKKNFGKTPKKKVNLSITFISAISLCESLSIIFSMGKTIQNMIFNGFFGGIILFAIIYTIYSILHSMIKQPSVNSQETQFKWNTLAFSNEDDYVRRCLAVEFQDENESRTFKSDPALTTVLTPLNSREYSKAIKAGNELLSRFPDFDLIYKWIGSAYRATQQLQSSREILSEGLTKVKRKSLLLTDIGETEWRLGNLEAALYWWSQALHCLSVNMIDYNAYLLMSYLAKVMDLPDFEEVLLSRADALRGGQVRLDSQTAGQLTTLVENNKTDAIKKVLQGLQVKYFS